MSFKKRKCWSVNKDSNTMRQFELVSNSTWTLAASEQRADTNALNEGIWVGSNLTSSSIQDKGESSTDFQRLQTCKNILNGIKSNNKQINFRNEKMKKNQFASSACHSIK